MIQETAYAKLNLALHIIGKRADGYHALDTIFAFCAHGDVLTAAPADELVLTLDGAFAQELAADESNLVLRAARALQAASGVKAGAHLHLVKNLPIASGIGGGSADAAAALRALVRLRKLEALPLEAIAQGLGADVLACVHSQTMRGQGVGDELSPLDMGLARTPVLLVNPRVALSTPAVFKAWSAQTSGYVADAPLADTHGSIDIRTLTASHNALTAPAIALAPEIAPLLTTLAAQSGATLTRMSGSGATCFTLFDTHQARDAAAATLAAHYPHYWLFPSELRA
jgi:4-diphosphocytidyl-2-C-methyl-D-erythritol kinase